MNRFSLGVVVYNPTETEFNKIKDYKDSGIFEMIYIYDNSQSPSIVDFADDKCIYTFQNNNSGLAIPYNLMIQSAKNMSIDYLCIMDQDSSFELSEIKKIIADINEYDDSQKIAIFCPMVVSDISLNNRKQTHWEKIDWTINSGSIININCFTRYQLSYDENIFLDGLDYDMCWTINEKGLNVLRNNDVVLCQTFGYKNVEHQKFVYHSAFRYYLIAHNRKYIYQKHFGKIIGLIYAQLKNVYLSFRILRHEESKFSKVMACYKGIIK